MKRAIFFLVFGLLCIGTDSFASNPPAGQTVGGIIQRENQQMQEDSLKERLQSERPEVKAENEIEEKDDDSGPRVKVMTIRVEGVTLLDAHVVQGIIIQYEGRELSLKLMQKVADLITAEYRKRGYVTSRAYLPPQDLRSGTLIIRVIEGKLGNVDIRGNKNFSTKLLKKNIGMEQEGYFDYSALQKALVYINENPDRTAKAILVPGQVPGTTDVVLEVVDRKPIHVGFEYDNWGSRYIDRSRYATILEHNNLFGQDDKLYVKGQAAENQQLALGLLRYVYPISAGFEVGGYAAYSKVRSGDEFADLDSEGKAELFGLFVNKSLINTATVEIRANAGFDFKSIEDSSLDIRLSRDEVRVVKLGLDFDVSDPLGRTILTTEVDQGLDDILGAMAAKDPYSSRGGSGSGAKFTKGVFNLFRLQPLPKDMALLWKNSAQYTNHTLIASEEFQIGGATTVRGYPPAEHTGDNGYYTSLELSIPPYFIDRTKKVPFTKSDTWYNTLRFVAFWDFGYVNRKNPDTGSEGDYALRGAGFGARLNLSEHLDCRVELGYPLGGPTPSDGDHMHPWVEFSYKF